MEGQNIVMQDLFTFRQSGVDENGRIVGEFKPTGAMPTFFDTLKSRGINLDPRIFQP
jgi:pilus assembly protein CpaF